MVFGSATPAPRYAWLLLSALLLTSATALIALWSLRRCDGDLRRWYDLNQGRKVMT
jgi:hypothetical protein